MKLLSSSFQRIMRIRRAPWCGWLRVNYLVWCRESSAPANCTLCNQLCTKRSISTLNGQSLHRPSGTSLHRAFNLCTDQSIFAPTEWHIFAPCTQSISAPSSRSLLQGAQVCIAPAIFNDYEGRVNFPESFYFTAERWNSSPIFTDRWSHLPREVVRHTFRIVGYVCVLYNYYVPLESGSGLPGESLDPMDRLYRIDGSWPGKYNSY